MQIDNIFGTIIDPPQRLAYYADRLQGVRHLHRLDPRDPAPGQPITLTLTTGGPRPFDAARCWWRAEAPDGSASEHVADLRPAEALWDPVGWEYARAWQVTLPAQPAGTMLRYRLAARLAGGEEWQFADNDAADAAAATEFAVWVADDPPPQWAREAVVYHIFLDRFSPGQGRPWLRPASLAGFYGGTLRGVIEQLDYIQGLGFSAIWLSPLFPSPTHHGYDATDYYAVEPRLGTTADLQELIAQAHNRGMRVILDFVANHWSHLHPTFQSAQSDPASPYRDWYTWNQWPDDYETYFGVRELPQLNLRRGPARDYLLECARYWLGQGVDGLRLDYAHGPPHDFWADFRRACREARPDCWLFGEVIHHADKLLSYSGRMDGTLDFLLAWAMRQTFGHGSWDLARFEAFLAGHEAYFPPEFVRPAFFDNHDMNRFLFIAGGDAGRLKLAALVLFTLAAPPIVYNGTEVGVTQERPIHQNDFGIFEEARQPMKWGDDQDADLREYFRRLIALRRGCPDLISPGRRVLHLDAAAGTYAYLRPGAAPVVVALNMGDQARLITLPAGVLPPGAADRLNGHPLRRVGDLVELELPPGGGAFVA